LSERPPARLFVDPEALGRDLGVLKDYEQR